MDLISKKNTRASQSRLQITAILTGRLKHYNHKLQVFVQTPRTEQSCCASTSCFANVRTMLQHQRGKPEVSLQPHFTAAAASGPLPRAQPHQTPVENLPILRALLIQLCLFTLNITQHQRQRFTTCSSIRLTLMNNTY